MGDVVQLNLVQGLRRGLEAMTGGDAGPDADGMSAGSSGGLAQTAGSLATPPINGLIGWLTNLGQNAANASTAAGTTATATGASLADGSSLGSLSVPTISDPLKDVLRSAIAFPIITSMLWSGNRSGSVFFSLWAGGRILSDMFAAASKATSDA